MKNKVLVFSILFCVNLLLSCAGNACTGTSLIAEDGSVVFARTLEFAQLLDSQVILIPRGFSFTGITPEGQNGIKWNSKYAALGANFLGEDYLLDGFNEEGLCVAGFYFPGYAGYQDVIESDYSKALAPQQLITWLLTNFGSVAEVKKALPDIKVSKVVFKQWGEILPLHVMVTDSKGNSIVVEYVKGQLNIYDNPYGVLTNSPTFDWQVLNITNYLNLSTNDVESKTIRGKVFSPFGVGSGMTGLPGDFTPPSRFIRVLYFSMASVPVKNAKDTVVQVFHILNSFDISKGSIRAKDGNIREIDYTQWTTASDLANKRYYYKTENNSRVRVVNMMDIDLNAKEIKKLTMETPEDDILNVTSQLK